MKEELLALLKERGLETTEEAAKEVIILSKDMLALIVKTTPNKVDDMVWGAVQGLYEEALLGFAEDINKADNA